MISRASLEHTSANAPPHQPRLQASCELRKGLVHRYRHKASFFWQTRPSLTPANRWSSRHESGASRRVATVTAGCVSARRSANRAGSRTSAATPWIIWTKQCESTRPSARATGTRPGTCTPTSIWWWLLLVKCRNKPQSKLAHVTRADNASATLISSPICAKSAFIRSRRTGTPRPFSVILLVARYIANSPAAATAAAAAHALFGTGKCRPRA